LWNDVLIEFKYGGYKNGEKKFRIEKIGGIASNNLGENTLTPRRKREIRRKILHTRGVPEVQK